MGNDNECKVFCLLFKRRTTYHDILHAMDKYCINPDNCVKRAECTRKYDIRCEFWRAPKKGINETNFHKQNQHTATRRVRSTSPFETTAPVSMQGTLHGVWTDSPMARFVVEPRRPFSTRGEDNDGEL